MQSAMDSGIEAQISEWRTYLLRRRTIQQVDVEELEDHLRSEMSELGAAGLSGDESFLVAIKRIGSMNELSREFARERSSRLWKQLVLAGDSVRERPAWLYAELAIMAGFAVAGIGVGVLVPLAFSAAGEAALESSDEVIAKVNLFNYGGALLGAVLLGALSEPIGLQWAFAIPVVAVIATLPLARRVGHLTTREPAVS